MGLTKWTKPFETDHVNKKKNVEHEIIVRKHSLSSGDKGYQGYQISEDKKSGRRFVQ
jgi:hypothetical protein